MVPAGNPYFSAPRSFVAKPLADDEDCGPDVPLVVVTKITSVVAAVTDGTGSARTAADAGQCANAMTAVRSCCAVAAILSVAVSLEWPAASSVCCTGTGVVCPKTGNRTFHTVVTFGGAPCDDGTANAAAAVLKCCPPDRQYDPAGRSCRRPADPDAAAAAFRRIVFTLRRFRSLTAAGFAHEPPKCDAGSVLADVPVDETAGPDGTPNPALDYCLDLKWTPDGGGESPAEELVARACRPRDRYCRGRYTCANKCCRLGKMLVDG